jgi:hypothetical protein
METDPLDAQSALDAVAAAEQRSAQIATSTPWYAPWYGITCAALSASVPLTAVRSWAGMILLVLGCASLAILVSTYRRVTGVWPSGQGMLGHMLVAIVLLFGVTTASYIAAVTYGVGWWLLAASVIVAVAVAVAVATTVMSRLYDAAYARKHGAR